MRKMPCEERHKSHRERGHDEHLKEEIRGAERRDVHGNHIRLIDPRRECCGEDAVAEESRKRCAELRDGKNKSTPREALLREKRL